MNISKNLCITLDWSRTKNENDVEVFRIVAYDDCQFHADDVYMEIIDIPVPNGIKNLEISYPVLAFKKVSKSKAELVWLYDSDKSILYNATGQKAGDMEIRRFMKLLFNGWKEKEII